MMPRFGTDPYKSYIPLSSYTEMSHHNRIKKCRPYNILSLIFSYVISSMTSFQPYITCACFNQPQYFQLLQSVDQVHIRQPIYLV